MILMQETLIIRKLDQANASLPLKGEKSRETQWGVFIESNELELNGGDYFP